MQTRQLDRGFLGTELSGFGQEPVLLTGVSVRLAGDPANPDWDADGLTDLNYEIERWNPTGSFPTLIIRDKSIIGYQEEQIREALKG